MIGQSSPEIEQGAEPMVEFDPRLRIRLTRSSLVPRGGSDATDA